MEIRRAVPRDFREGVAGDLKYEFINRSSIMQPCNNSVVYHLNQSINHLVKRSINQSINQSTNQYPSL